MIKLENLPHITCKSLVSLTNKNFVRPKKSGRGKVKWVECGKRMELEEDYWVCTSGHKLRKE